MKIAVALNKDGSVRETNRTDEDTAIRQSHEDGWTLVEDNQYFSEDNISMWTIRESDNKLVHITTNMTPDEESQSNITQLTQSSLANQMTGVQLQTAVTALTQSNLQLTMDNAQLKSDRDTSQKAITELTTKFLTFQMTNTQTDTSTK